jgi:hypothetical protein
LFVFLLSSALGTSTGLVLVVFISCGFLHQHAEQAVSSYGIGSYVRVARNTSWYIHSTCKWNGATIFWRQCRRWAGGRCLDTLSTYTCRTGTGTAKRELANLLKTGPDKRNEKVVCQVR